MHFAAFTALFPDFAPFGASLSSTTSLCFPLLSLSSLSSLLLSLSPGTFLPLFVVGCFSSGFDSWRLRCWFDVDMGLRVSPLRVFEVLERVLVGMLIVDQWAIGGWWGWEERMSQQCHDVALFRVPNCMWKSRDLCSISKCVHYVAVWLNGCMRLCYHSRAAVFNSWYCSFF